MQHLLHVYCKNIHGDVNLICLSITSVCWYICTHQGTCTCRIQQFPNGGSNYYLSRFLLKTAWKWKKLGRLDPQWCMTHPAVSWLCPHHFFQNGWTSFTEIGWLCQSEWYWKSWAEHPAGRQTPPRLGRHPTAGRHSSPLQTATVADGTHPTGIHSCFLFFKLMVFFISSSLIVSPPLL